MADHDRILLDYATPTTSADIDLLVKMRRWRAITSWGIVLALASSILAFLAYDTLISAQYADVIYPCLAGIAALAIFAASVMTLLYMTRAARQVSPDCATRHLLLAVVLLPVFFLGLFLVPLLVESEVVKWHDRGNNG